MKTAARSTDNSGKRVETTWPEINVLVCEHCGGRRSVLTFLTDPPVLRRILDHLGLPAVAPARAPPEPELPFA